MKTYGRFSEDIESRRQELAKKRQDQMARVKQQDAQAVGDAAAFCRSNILKYASRYDKKGTTRLDIQKIIHYAVLLYHFEGLDKETTNGYETF